MEDPMNESALVAEPAVTFDPEKFKAGQREAWSAVAEGWTDGVGRAMAQLSMPLVDYAEVQPGDRVLDLASGGGTASFAAATIGAREVIASDIAPGFRSIIEGQAKDLGLGNVVKFAEVDMESIPYKDGEFDRVLCQLGIMFPPDRAKALREVYRVLKSGGRFSAATLCSADENPEVAPMLMYPASLLGVSKDAPNPFNCGDRDRVKGEFEAAGFVDVHFRDFPMIARSATLDEAMHSWTNVGPIGSVLSKVDTESKGKILDFLRNWFLKFEQPDHSIEMKIGGILFSGKKP
jgi:SAM-dependent methyltransferase